MTGTIDAFEAWMKSSARTRAHRTGANATPLPSVDAPPERPFWARR